MSRWYSSAEGTQNAEKTGDSATDQSAVKDDPREKELQAKSKEIVDLKVCLSILQPRLDSNTRILPTSWRLITEKRSQDKYLRTVADYRNLQEQTRREVKAAKDFALQKFARDLIESVDNLDLAIQSVPAEKLAADDAADLKQLHGGLKMTETILMNTLKKYGMERFDPSETAARFDPNLHEATFQTPQPGKEDGTVFHTTSKGFTLNGRVLRVCSPVDLLPTSLLITIGGQGWCSAKYID